VDTNTNIQKQPNWIDWKRT